MITILDASVAIKWFLVEPETPRAIAVARNILAGSAVFAVPELFYYEVFSVVIRKHKDPSSWAASGMHWLLNLPLQRMTLTQPLAEEMARFVDRGLTGCDAAYAALATLNRGTWLTFDKKASRLLGAPKWVAHP